MSEEKSTRWLKLRSYEERDKDIFHGRDREITEIINTLYNSILITITGLSGVGKTSLIKAGLFPKLRKEHFFPVYIRLKSPLQEGSLVKQIISEIRKFAESDEENISIKPLITNQSGDSLWEFFHCNEFLKGEEQFTPLFVLDQLGELFDENDSQKESKKNEAVEALFEELSYLCSNKAPEKLLERLQPKLNKIDWAINYKIILSLRDDYLVKLAAFEEKIPVLKKNLFFIQPLNGEHASKIIQQVEGEGFSHKECDDNDKTSDSKLAELIVRTLAEPKNIKPKKFKKRTLEKSDDESPKSTLKQLKIKPAILSLFMGELHEKEETKAGYITKESVEKYGKDIIFNFYKNAMKKTSNRCIRIVEKKLISSKGKRKSVACEDLKIMDRHLKYLKKENILNTIEGKAMRYVEYAHDVLAEPAFKNRKRRAKRDSIIENIFVALLGILMIIGAGRLNFCKNRDILKEINKDMSAPILLNNNDSIYMGMYEVSQKQFYQIMGYNPSIKIVGLIDNHHIFSKRIVTKLMNFLLSTEEKETMSIGDGFSVRYVSWQEASDFIDALNSLNKRYGDDPYFLHVMLSYIGCHESNTSNYEYMLPTAEEWKHAAQGGYKHISWNEAVSMIHELQKLDSMNDYKNILSEIDEWEKTATNKDTVFSLPIATKYSGSDNIEEVAWYFRNAKYKALRTAKLKPNGYGLYDMSGNLFEWCIDTDTTETKRRLIGGSFASMARECEISSRPIFETQDVAPENVGFRLKAIKMKK